LYTFILFGFLEGVLAARIPRTLLRPMGLSMSRNDGSGSASLKSAPPPVVLVPPLFERDLRMRNRMAHSSYDYMFAKPAMRFLFDDYVNALGRTWLNFRPTEDPRVSVAAVFDTPLEDPKQATGLINLRFQPNPDDYSNFFDIKAAAKSGGIARARACYFDPTRGLGAWGSLPLLASSVTGPEHRAHLGVRYSSPIWTAGAVVSPALKGEASLEHLWVGGQQGSFSFGAQCSPNQPFSKLQGGIGGGAQSLLDALAEHTSYALAYTPVSAQAPGRGTFTAAVEVQEQRQMVVSFLYHMAVQRNVRNPFESRDAAAIVNYVDVGLQVATDVASAGNGNAPPASSAASLAVAWQANKGLLVKAKVGTDSIGAAVAFKSWWHPSWVAAASANWLFATNSPKFGITLGVENHGNIRYERPKEVVLRGAAVVQRHIALPADIRNREGEGLLVTPDQFDDKNILGQVPRAADQCL